MSVGIDILGFLPFAEAESGEGQGLHGIHICRRQRLQEGRNESMVSISNNDILFLLPFAEAGSGEGLGLPGDPDLQETKAPGRET